MKPFDITVKQWQVIHDIISTEENELIRWLQIMPMITDKSAEYYRGLLTSDFWKEANPYKFGLFEKKPSDVIVSKWEHNGRVMVCDPRLNKITGGKFIDSLELSKHYKANNNDPYPLMHKFLAIYWKDEKGGYDPDTYEERCEYIQNDMPTYIALPAFNHFFQLWIASLPSIQAYLNRRAQETGSPTDGDGMPRSTGWRTVTGRIGNTLRKWVSLSSLITWRTSRTKAKGKSR